MTRIVEPVMDPHTAADGPSVDRSWWARFCARLVQDDPHPEYSRLDRLDGLDTDALNLHERAELETARMLALHPHIRRYGQFDPVTGRWQPWTVEEAEDRAWRRRTMWATAGLAGIILGCGVAGVAIIWFAITFGVVS